MDTEIPELNTAGLRRFSLTTAGLLAGLFGIILPFLYQRPRPLWPWIIALVLILWGVFLPARLRVLYRVWMTLALLLGKINSILILSVLFIGVISPVAIMIRLFGYDPLQRKYMSHVSTYRKPCAKHLRNHMEKPY